MGLYSEVVCSCPALGEDFQGVLQTKSLTSLLDTFFLAPDGTLYEVQGSWSDPRERLSTRGRVRPYRKSGILRFTSFKDGVFLEALTYFKCGVLNSVICSGPMFSCESLGGG